MKSKGIDSKLYEQLYFTNTFLDTDSVSSRDCAIHKLNEKVISER